VQGPVKDQWDALCEQAAVEQDPQQLITLVKEINRLLAEKQDRLEAKATKQET